MILNWFFSKTARQARQLHQHVHKILSAQRDILSPQAVGLIEAGIAELKKTVAGGADKKTLEDGMTKLEGVANKWLKPYPHASLRENVEVFLVAIAVAMAIRTFFLQPFKIPTGSMQPTLFGIKDDNLINKPDAPTPNAVTGFFQFWLTGESFKNEVAGADGRLRIEKPKRFLLFNLYQKYSVGDSSGTIWFPDDRLFDRAGLQSGMDFKKGETIMKLKVISGDHLFVDRLSYNFIRPRRGDIVVFETKGIPIEQVERLGRATGQMIPRDQFYIKRLVGLGGEQLRIGADNHLIIDGRRLDASTPGFGKLYGWTTLAATNDYVGHQLEFGRVECLLRNPEDAIQIRPKHYVVMGDNTRNSQDSRYFGDFPRDYVIGRAAFVYWPFTKRFLRGYTRGD